MKNMFMFLLLPFGTQLESKKIINLLLLKSEIESTYDG